MVSSYMFKSSVHFKLTFVYCVGQRSSFLNTIYYGDHPFPIDVFGSLVKYQLTANVGVYFWLPVPLLCVYFYNKHIFKLLCSSIVQFEIRKYNASKFLLPHDCFAIQSMVSYKFGDFFFLISVKNSVQVLIAIVLNLKMALSSKDILIMLSLLIHRHGISFHFFVSSSVTFINVLQFSSYRSFISLVKFSPNYFIV